MGAVSAKWLGLALSAVVVAGLGVLTYGLMAGRAQAPFRATLSVSGALRDESLDGFARAGAPRAFSFPEDHGPHPEFRIEWWYWTGNLKTGAGRRFGFQLTFFRTALSAEPRERGSAWGTATVYMAHFALADIDGGRFYASDRFSREALGLAGARADPFRVWLEDWSASAADGGKAPPMRLQAAQGRVAVDLTLLSAKPVVLHGQHGLSRKGAQEGNASYYYSLTRMPARGSVTVGSTRFQVTGLGWMDREWSSSMLERDQIGWDWFALQLSDGRELMLFRIRRSDGGVDPHSGGTLVAVDGSARALAGEDVRVEVLDRWRSPRDGTRYPSHWRITVPAEELEIEVTPGLADQELNVALRYWEGAVRLRGSAGGKPLGGYGYVELTGYADAG